MNRSAAIVIADGYTDAEFLVAFHMLKAASFEVSVYSLNSGPVTGIQGWVQKESGLIRDCNVDLTATPSNEKYHRNFCDAGILVLVGGVKAIEKLRLCKPLIRAINTRNAEHGLIASICHGAQLLIEADIFRGDERSQRLVVSGYASIRRDIENAGAEFSEAAVCKCANIISSPHYDFAGIWVAEMIKEFDARS